MAVQFRSRKTDPESYTMFRRNRIWVDKDSRCPIHAVPYGAESGYAGIVFYPHVIPPGF
jgi:hypothetical protein